MEFVAIDVETANADMATRDWRFPAVPSRIDILPSPPRLIAAAAAVVARSRFFFEVLRCHAGPE